MIGYKLLRKRKDGTLGPLFINRKQVIPFGVRLPAEDHKTNGYAHRPGWHACPEPKAPHLSMDLAGGEERVWCKVKLYDFVEEKRPVSQGGTWLLAGGMKVLEEVA
jgi:hypothetical protein